MNISSVEVIGLFGYFNHRIPFKLKDRITIVHGPNGVGKTTVLRLLQDLFSLRLNTVLRIPFDKVIIRFSPKGVLTITSESEGKEQRYSYLHLTYRSGKYKVEYKIDSPKEQISRRKYPVSIIDKIVHQLDRVGPEEWLDRNTGEFLSIEDVIYKYGDLLPEEFQKHRRNLPEKIKEVLENTNIYLIETQRLFTKSSYQQEVYDPRYKRIESRERMTVEEYSDDVVNNIQQLVRESGTLSASLDRDFPRRLLETALPQEATENKIRELYANQTKYRERLMRAGLMKPEEQVPLPSGELGEIERKVLWIYLTDVQKKLQIFDILLLKSELLGEIINSRFSYKTFELNAEFGFHFISDNGDSRVPLRSLSSGEQHELVLAYDLLFRVKSKSLVLIDEPELSLHVSWQRKFLEDIAKIAELADLNFLIATHSPSIIDNRRDLMVGLGGEQ